MSSITTLVKLGLFHVALVVGFGLLPQGLYAGQPANIPVDFTQAAKRNSTLKYSLRWSLGRRRQSGWYLYTALIQETVKTRSNENSPGFARGIFGWQRRHRLSASGVVDQKTLYSFVRHWQSQRIRKIVLADEHELLTAPIANFFDPTRETKLLKMEKRTYAAYKKMLAAAIADRSLGLKRSDEGSLSDDEKFLKIISSYRSPEYQAKLRKKLPGASRAQIAYRSPHFTGRALDIFVGAEPVTTKDFNRAIQVKTPVYKWLVRNAAKFGFYPYFYEPWHWEYVPENHLKSDG